MSDIYHNLVLTHGHSNLGSLRVLDQGEPTSSEIPATRSDGRITTTVTGITESRLDEIRSYNPEQPYILGVNGVQQITGTEVVYLLDGITYTTSLGDLTTTYSFGLVTEAQALETHFLYRDERDVFIDKHETQRDILMSRSEMSVFDPMIRIAGVNSLDDLADYFNT